jgi:hypothetical protein
MAGKAAYPTQLPNLRSGYESGELISAAQQMAHDG